MVPVVARHRQVREVMRERQRELGEHGNAVIEGRDIGTVVAPDAAVKVYLVADRDERARRRDRRAARASAPTRSPPTCALRDEQRRGADAAGRRRRADRHDGPHGRGRRRRGSRRSCARAARVNRVDVVWAIGRLTIGQLVRRSRAAPRLRRGARAGHGGIVLALQPLLLDRPAAFGYASPRHDLLHGEDRGAPQCPGSAQLIRAFGTFSVRRGESDREAVRLMRAGRARRAARSGSSSRARGSAAACPGRCSPAPRWSRCRRACPVVPAAIHGSHDVAAGQLQPGLGRLGRADALRRAAARDGKGYREASREIEREIRPALGVARRACTSAGPPDAGATLAVTDDASRAAARHRRDRRLPERRQVDARQPADRHARGGRARDAGRHARPQGARLRVERQAASC